MTQGCLQCACRHLSVISPSRFSCFTRPCSCCSLTDTSRPFPTSTTSLTFLPTRSCTTSPTWKAQEERTPHDDQEFGYLADSTHSTGKEPKEFDKIASVDDDATLINDQNHSISDFSKTTNENTSQSVFPQCLNPLFCTFLIVDFALETESKEGMHRETDCWTERERERRKEKVLWSVLHSRRQRKINGTASVTLKSHRNSCSKESQKILFWWMRSPRTPGTSLGENSVQRNYTRLGTTWKSKIWSEEMQNTHYSSHNESLNLKDDKYWKPINWQIKLNVRQ